jgi:hypothetical protein
MTEELKDAYGSIVSQIVAAIEDELTRYEGHKGEDDWQRESAAIRMVLYRVREVAKITAEKVNPTACDLDVSPWQCPNCYSGSGECTAKQSPDGRTIDKAMVKRLAIQHGMIPGGQVEQPQVALKEVCQAIADYHFELDSRQHGEVAKDRAFNAICKALGAHWEPGAELKRRVRHSAGAKP